MPDNKFGGGKDSVCIHTRKVYDACRSQDCLEDLRLILTGDSQNIVDRATNIKPKSAQILWTYIDVEPVPFNDGFFSVDASICYRITADAYCGVGRPYEIEGFARYDKHAILYGSEGKARTYSSQMIPGSSEEIQLMPRTNLPLASIEVVDPILLSVRVVEPCDRFCGIDSCGCHEVPDHIAGCFQSPFVNGDNCRRVYITLGQFSIMRLERDTQLLIPHYDYCIPEKECPTPVDGDVCDMFARFRFPTNDFFPPDNTSKTDGFGCTKK